MEENKFQREVLDRLITLETLIKEQDYKSIRDKTEEAEYRSIDNEKRITKLEDKNIWLTRLIAAQIIGLVFSILLAILKLGFKL